MARIDDLLKEALMQLPAKPNDKAKQAEKKRYSELLSQRVALAVADELRFRGLDGARPAGAGQLGDSGAERRMAGGLGAKKVDVTWATPEAGLLLGISIKSINFRDSRTRNFQKNLVNRRGDMVMEAVTLHRRFPYAVLGGLFFFDNGAAADGTGKRRSTFENAHLRFQLFSNRPDPAGREEQFEKFYFLLVDVSSVATAVRAFRVGDAVNPVTLEDMVSELLQLVALRNPDFYEFVGGNLVRAS